MNDESYPFTLTNSFAKSIVNIIVKKNAKAINTEIIDSTKSVLPISSRSPLIPESKNGSKIAANSLYKKAIKIVWIVGIETKTNTEISNEFPVITEADEEYVFIVLILSVNKDPTNGIEFCINRLTDSLTAPPTVHVITPLTVMKKLYNTRITDVIPINVILIRSDSFEKEVAGCIRLIKSRRNAAIIDGINTFSAMNAVNEEKNTTAGFHKVTSNAPPETAIPAVSTGYIPKKSVTNWLVRV